MGRGPDHPEIPRGRVALGLALAALASLAGGEAAAQQDWQREPFLAAARATEARMVDPGQEGDATVVGFLDSYFDYEVLAAPSTLELGDCGERSVPAAPGADSAGLICAILRADIKGGGEVAVRFPVGTTLTGLVADRSLHYAGIEFSGVSRGFASLKDLVGYLGNRHNMLMYFNPAVHVVVAEIREMQLMPTSRGHPTIHWRGRVVRSLKGDWSPGEPINYVTATEDRPDWFEAANVFLPDPPRLNIVFLNEHSAGTIYVDTGWSWTYGLLGSDAIVEDLAEAHRLAVEAEAAR